MSGTISGGGRDDLIQHYYQRFNELTQKNTNKSLATSTVGSLSESTVNGHYFNKKGQIINGALTTHQFYNKSSNQDHRIQAENMPSNQLLMEGSSTYTGVSDTSVFKKPLPVKRFNCSSLIERRLDLMVEAVRSIEDKPTLKFTMTTIETLVHSIKNPPAQPVNPVDLIDYISNLVKEEYVSKRVPKSICGSSVMSDQASNVDQYARVVLQDITQSSMYRPQLPRPPQGLNNSEYSSIGRTGLLPYDRQETSTRSEARKKGELSSGQRLLETLTGSNFNLFNDSEIAQKRDEAAASQAESQRAFVVPKTSSKTLAKATPKPTMNSSKVSRMTKALATAYKKPSNEHSKVSVPVSENCTLDQGNKNISLLNGTANGISRSGRILKPPVKYWNSKGEELSCGDIDESVFNESMTLRNQKVLDRKKTPPVRGRKTNTPNLPDITENKVCKPSTTKKNPRGRPPLLTRKENMVAEKKKPVKKPAETPTGKSTSSKGKTNKKKEELASQNTEKAVKKPAPKRKSKESNDRPMVSKKKKVEDPAASDVEEDDIFGVENYRKPKHHNQKNTEKAVKKPASKRKSKESNDRPMVSTKKKVEDPVASDVEEDDIFGVENYRKPKHHNQKLVLSPSAALLSAKKAAGEAQGKATPPCKAIGDMMANESIQSTMSASKEAPKQNEAVKRIIKKMEKDQMKAPTQSKAKTQVKNTRKKDSQLNNLIEAAKSYSVENAMCSATLNVFRGNVQESDLSDMEQDDDDEDDDLM